MTSKIIYYRELSVNQKINFKKLLVNCGFKSISDIAYNKYMPIHPINPIFD